MEANIKPCSQPNEKQKTPKLLHLQPAPRAMLCKVPWLLLPWSWGCTLFPISGGIGAVVLTQAAPGSCTL